MAFLIPSHLQFLQISDIMHTLESQDIVLWKQLGGFRTANSRMTDSEGIDSMRSELTSEEQSLLAMAVDAAQRAYAPYSNFRVGAAVRTEAGLFTGCNIENASYGLSVCAERTAIFAAVGAGARRIEMVAVSCVDTGLDTGIGGRMPCGACRQVIAEFADRAVPVIVHGAGVWQVNELLPEPFEL